MWLSWRGRSREMSCPCNFYPVYCRPFARWDGSMKFTILSHAGLAIEHAGIQVVCDPWLIGSCYWRSWWNFPEPDPDLVRNLAPDYIYLTHLHWDHFHGPSLKKLFRRDTRVIVPKTCTRRMVDDLTWLGFGNIIEISHGASMDLGADMRLHSYQFGLGVDSAAVFTGGGYTLFDCNDCKFFGLPLRQILRAHPKIDFIFRSHSSASPVPFCIENHDKLFGAASELAYDSADQFARCALHVGARYAIPFASNHCFLHRETQRFNATATTPDLAKQRFSVLSRQSPNESECVVMPPGSSWSDRRGFELSPFDFSKRDEYVAAMLERHSTSLAKQYETETGTLADFAAFKLYFAQLLAAIPWLVRRRLDPLVFRVRDRDGVRDWLIDPRKRLIAEQGERTRDCVIFQVHAAVVNDCAKQKMFSVWTASKRLRIHLPSAAHLRIANFWMTILDLYEVDLLPLAKNLSFRALGVRLRRWREPVEVAVIIMRRVFFRKAFSVSALYPLPGEDAARV